MNECGPQQRVLVSAVDRGLCRCACSSTCTIHPSLGSAMCAATRECTWAVTCASQATTSPASTLELPPKCPKQVGDVTHVSTKSAGSPLLYATRHAWCPPQSCALYLCVCQRVLSSCLFVFAWVLSCQAFMMEEWWDVVWNACIHTHTHTHIHIHTHAHMHAFNHTLRFGCDLHACCCAYIYTWMRTIALLGCIFESIYIHMYTQYTHICIHNTYICINKTYIHMIYIYIYIYIYTHTHTYVYTNICMPHTYNQAYNSFTHTSNSHKRTITHLTKSHTWHKHTENGNERSSQCRQRSQKGSKQHWSRSSATRAGITRSRRCTAPRACDGSALRVCVWVRPPCRTGAGAALSVWGRKSTTGTCRQRWGLACIHSVCIHTRAYIHMHTYMCIHAYAYIHVHTCMCIHSLFIHTYVQIWPDESKPEAHANRRGFIHMCT